MTALITLGGSVDVRPVTPPPVQVTPVAPAAAITEAPGPELAPLPVLPVEGPPGPRGVAGGGSTVYTLTGVASWSAAHDYSFPSVTVLDSAGREVDTDVDHIDASHLSVVFASPFTGKIVLRG